MYRWYFSTVEAIILATDVWVAPRMHNMTMNDEEQDQLSTLNITVDNMALIHLVYRLDFESFGYAMVQP